MKTLTFYSFKGGVGRSLTLSNMAVWLADEMKAKVCVIDFDLEAPGLPYKFEDLQNNDTALQQLAQTEGIVEYVDEFKQTGVPPADFNRFYVSFNTHKGNPIHLIPAGNVEQPTYWDKLFNINWQDLFKYDPATGYSQGLLLLEDLKGRIQEELNPDFLLIDSRTGLTEIAAITLKLLADKIILVGINNRENQDGLFWILRSLQADPISKNLPFHLVLNRIPLKTNRIDPREKEVGKVFLERFTELFPIESLEENFSIIHADDELAFEEKVERGFMAESAVKAQMRKDYWDLFSKTLKSYFDVQQWKDFDKKSQAYNLYHEAKFDLTDSDKRIQNLNKAINLCPQDDFLYFELGNLYNEKKDYTNAINSYHKAIAIKPNFYQVYHNIGSIYYELENYDKAIQFFLTTIYIEPISYKSYFNLGITYNDLKQYEKAIEFYQKAIAIKPDYHEAYDNMVIVYSKLEQYEEAIEAYQKAHQLGGRVYNLACLYALQGQKEDALKWLRQSLEKQEISVADIKDTDWDNLREDPDFKALIVQYE